jgi:cytochrome c-type biogenesis protein CcmH
MKRFVGAVAIAFASLAYAGLDAYEFADAAEEQRFKALIAELRCLVCQNQSLLDSDAGLAEDLRRETYNLMKTGRDDTQIVQFLVDRYGDFVLYRPPLKPSTYLLWFGPVLLFAGAGFWVYRTIRNQQPIKAISEEQAERAAQLLDEESE